LVEDASASVMRRERLPSEFSEADKLQIIGPPIALAVESEPMYVPAVDGAVALETAAVPAAQPPVAAAPFTLPAPVITAAKAPVAAAKAAPHTVSHTTETHSHTSTVRTVPAVPAAAAKPAVGAKAAPVAAAKPPAAPATKPQAPAKPAAAAKAPAVPRVASPAPVKALPPKAAAAKVPSAPAKAAKPPAVPSTPSVIVADVAAAANGTKSSPDLALSVQKRASVFHVLLFGLSVTAALFSSGILACMLQGRTQEKQQLADAHAAMPAQSSKGTSGAPSALHERSLLAATAPGGAASPAPVEGRRRSASPETRAEESCW